MGTVKHQRIDGHKWHFETKHEQPDDEDGDVVQDMNIHSVLEKC